MKTIIVYTTLLVLACCVQFLNAQETNNITKIEELTTQKEQILVEEKEMLKKEVEEINDKLSNDEITKEEAQQLKKEAAKNRALNIENRIAIIENKTALLTRNGSEYSLNPENTLTINVSEEDEENLLFNIRINGKKKERKVIYDRRTYTDLVIAFGLNNVIRDDQSLDDSDYKIAGSRFFELGWAWKTRVFKNSNFMRVKYGISYQSNGLKPTENRYFVENGNQTDLEEFDVELDKSKFRMDNLVIPVHLEFGPSKKKEFEDKIRYSIHRKFRIGIGGYIGVNISTRQKLKYKENGNKVKDKIKRDYNTSDLIYGVSAYLGFDDMSLYIKHDISPIFRNEITDQKNVSLGLRFDL